MLKRPCLFRIPLWCANMNEKVLVVEDEQVLRNSLEVRLRAEGYTVDTAADGNEGLLKATELSFDLIILDIMLPYRSGLDVCRGVRQKGLATPILMLTVRDQTLDKVVGLNLGADDYMTGSSIRYDPGRRPARESDAKRKASRTYESRVPTSLLSDGTHRKYGPSNRTLAVGLGPRGRYVHSHGRCARIEPAPKVGVQSEAA